jgi:hypothetical protein
MSANRRTVYVAQGHAKFGGDCIGQRQVAVTGDDLHGKDGSRHCQWWAEER